MRNLYARFVLFLIRPALERRYTITTQVRTDGPVYSAGINGGGWGLGRDGRISITPDASSA